MILPVVMAGGTGARLWPVSRDSSPKQFANLQQGKPSLFQQSLLRLDGLKNLGSPIVLCNKVHQFLAAEQVKNIGISQAEIILEPVVRNTAPAVALAALSAIARQKEDVILLILSADHLIEDIEKFHDAINKAVEAARQGSLVTFGIVTERAETGYGYIKRAEADGELYRVEEFVEKPNAQKAAEYCASGDYYWNSGMFVFRADIYLNELKSYAPEVYSRCKEAFKSSQQDGEFRQIPQAEFEKCPSDSIDYAVMEHTSKAMLVPLQAGWSDLGAWDALWDKAKKDQHQNAVEGDVILHNVKGSYIQATSRLVTVAGMEDAIVVETADSVLVTNKASSQAVKDLVQALKLQSRIEVEHPKVVLRPWGSYESLAGGPGFQVKRIIVKSGAALSLQLHHHRAEHWTVVKGKAKIINGDNEIFLTANQSIYIPVETKHRLENIAEDELILIEVQCGDYLGEDDIVRFEDRYGRAN